ncbi:MAG: ImmA/IrrE family metallo-endopeptidase [Frankiaceae bacterium]|nr:ImmA/IrrE family metallo-endopeptidase [Frankiaceae bacterium]
MNDKPTNSLGVLAALRRIAPTERLSTREALHLAERQAEAFRDLTSTTGARVSLDALRKLPHMRILRSRSLLWSGLSYWSGKDWVVCLDATEPTRRQRLTAFHEYKHIIDHGRAHIIYGADAAAADRAELVADYFAGCVLIPRRPLRQAWRSGMRDVNALARMFEASTRAVEVRLVQLGLVADFNPSRPVRMICVDIEDLIEPSCLRRSRQEAAA